MGSGKTSLLMSILGEMTVTDGDKSVNGSISYVPQEPWILSTSFKQNIVMGKDVNQEKYDHVIRCTSLSQVKHMCV